MVNEKLNKLLIGFVFLVVCFALDRLSKIYILNILNNEGQVDLYINQFLNIYLVWNTGIGFGLFSSEDKLFYNIFTAIIVIINLVILYFAFIESKIKSFFLMIILGGSLGNLFDRVYYRAVPDFIDLSAVFCFCITGSSNPKPPSITLKKDRFIPLHIIYDKIAPDAPTNAPVIIIRIFPRVKPIPQAAQPE